MEITNEEILRVITELRNNDESPCIEAKENELEVEKFGKTISAISVSYTHLTLPTTSRV